MLGTSGTSGTTAEEPLDTSADMIVESQESNLQDKERFDDSAINKLPEPARNEIHVMISKVKKIVTEDFALVMGDTVDDGDCSGSKEVVGMLVRQEQMQSWHA
ncbi:uncharacterized protein AMSG_12460 [Thecamonas trahens ATCC 50062]|uniref:Uncharacterized protein n=1 Tax=Thecamonas trahens ATCC 50062 TaxID=461836 RepID=A0A0L0DVH4_THETB|nr:hypothetical protein AMSG_12460 [Thecamonas trahens ATCC 50062]KNC56225.1 hypothetical protein AMSG_12460 [Thecamonas trahens ATCC 50062]|eukprot:XP_013752653.1 hypothetical protein AMSG_12460 [Thecamonas trahens ATCC 50062]